MAMLLAARPDLSSVKAIYASDLKRSHQTATPLSERTAIPVVTSPLLREGNWARHHRDPDYAPLPFDGPFEDGEALTKRAITGMRDGYSLFSPVGQRRSDLCHEFGIKVFHHDDGGCRPFLPLLIEMGIDILNPIQWTCPGMDMQELKSEFGDKICFHGAIENQRILPFGTPEEVRGEVRHCIDALASDGTGYILASCHNLQVNTPVENIIAMYDEAWQYGKIS